jgi:hypothetical protein
MLFILDNSLEWFWDDELTMHCLPVYVSFEGS